MVKKEENFDTLELTKEQANRFASNWLKTKLTEIEDIVQEIRDKLE